MSDNAEGEPLTAELDSNIVASAEVGTFPDSGDQTPTATAVAEGAEDTAAPAEDNQSEADTIEDPDLVYVLPEADLDEKVDENGHFAKFPPKKKEEYPQRSEALASLQKLHPGYDAKKGFVPSEIPEGDEGKYFYFIAKDYCKKLGDWLLESDDSDNEIDMTVDNSALMTNGTETQVRKGNMDAYRQIIFKSTWEQLIDWFGGGVCVRIKLTDGGASYRSMGKLLRCVSSADNSKFRRFYFNGKETVEEMKASIAEAFGEDPENCRLHDFFRHKPYARIDSEASMQLPISKKQLLHNNLMFLEVKNDKGKFTIKYKKKKTYQYTPGLSNYSYYNGGGYTSMFSREDSINGSKGPAGIVGLNNLGNTCYMNSIIQCLSNTPLLKEKFLSKAYETDINETNVLGYKGAVAKAFFGLMKLMWSGDGRVVRPAGFKKAINEAKTDFRGYQQHDSQEFLSELLDAMHEDLNRIINKPSTERVEARGRPDAEVAQESMQTYKLRNDSLVSDLFTGLYKSTVTCPEVTCGNISVTFDPYMIVPLPLQEGEKAYQVVQVIFVPLSPEQQPVQAEIIVPKHGPSYVLRELLKDSLGINDLNAAEREAKEANRLQVSDNANVKVALGYAEDDDDVVGHRDLLIFNYGVGKLGARPIDNRSTLSNLTKDVKLICFETFDYLSFEYFNYHPMEDWKRELNFPRSDIPIAAVAEENTAGTGEEKAEEVEGNEQTEKSYKNQADSVKSDGEIQDPLLQQDEPGETENVATPGVEGNDAGEGGATADQEDADDKKSEGIRRYPNIYSDNNDSDDEVEAPRVVRPDAVEAPADEKIRIGSVGCPFLMGDVWHGRYNHSSDSQHLRIEIVGVEKMDWSAYSNYKAEVIAKYGEQSSDAKLSEQDFAGRDVFFIHAEADSKEVLASYMRSRARKQSQFELKGVYITKDPFMEVVEIPKRVPERVKTRVPPVVTDSENAETGNKKGTSFFKGRTSSLFRKKSNAEEEQVDQENLYNTSNRLTPGSLEQKYIVGSFVLRPTEKRSVELVQPSSSNYTGYAGYSGAGYSRYGYSGYTGGGYGSQQDTSRDPIVLSGMIERGLRYMWGKFQVDQSYVKGEFTCQRFESMNWKNHEIRRNPTIEDQPIMSWSKFPAPLNSDNRVLIMMCHKMQNAAYRYPFGGVPDSFFVPAHVTECEVMEMIKARFKLYFKKELELAGAPLFEENPETGDPIDVVAERVAGLVVKRASDKFETRSYAWRSTGSIGKELDSQGDVPLNTKNDPFVWLVCEWDNYPFVEGRPRQFFTKDSNEAKMTLHKALDLFSQVDKLSAMNMWYCNKCREHKEAYKQMQLWSLPKVLVIQFKRFSQEETRMRADKLEIPVDFPFEIDLTDYTLSSQVAGKSMQADIDDSNKKLSEYDYELVAVSSHIGGGLGSGHYVASAKNENDGSWYDFNDSSVSKIPDAEKQKIVNPQAYVLFYVRKTELIARGKVLKEKKKVTEEQANETQQPTADVEVEANSNEATEANTTEDENIPVARVVATEVVADTNEGEPVVPSEFH